MMNIQIILSMLGWFFSPLISIFINRNLDRRKDNKDRQRAYTEIAEKVEMLVINEIDIDVQLINNMAHYISIKYRLKQPLKEQDILSRVNYEILSSIFVSKDVKSNILRELKQLNDEVISKKNNQTEKIILEEKAKERKETQRKIWVSLCFAYLFVIMLFLISVPIISNKNELAFKRIMGDEGLTDLISIVGAIFALLVSLLSLLFYNSSNKRRK